jgi:hypothetical protein
MIDRIDMIYLIGLRIFVISMRSAILSILFILSKYSTDVLGRPARARAAPPSICLSGGHARLRPLSAAWHAIARWAMRGIAWSIRGCAFVRMLRDEYAEAERLLDESLPSCRASGDAWGIAWSLYALAFLKLAQGDLVQARRALEEALAPRGVDPLQASPLRERARGVALETGAWQRRRQLAMWP